MLQARDIHKYYSSGKDRIHVLKGVSLSIREKETVAVLGPSGAGKSTLLHILGGLDRPDSGEVLFEARLFEKLPEADLSAIRNKAVGFVFQFYHLMPEFNVLENVMMPALISRRSLVSGPRAQAKAKELLKEVGLGHRLRHLPGQLSGGEQQRAAIARALINEPKLLLCDEPTGNLDSATSRQIIELLRRLNQEKGMSIVMVTHNLDIASFVSRVYYITDGQIEERKNK